MPTSAESHRTSGSVAACAAFEWLRPRNDEMIALLRRLVEIESPSGAPAGLARVAREPQGLFVELGTVRRHTAEGLVGGAHLEVHVQSDVSGAHALALCHYDTVWPLGTLDRVPFTVDTSGVARGPGCFDMKGGIVLLRFAL